MSFLFFFKKKTSLKEKSFQKLLEIISKNVEKYNQTKTKKIKVDDKESNKETEISNVKDQLADEYEELKRKIDFIKVQMKFGNTSEETKQTLAQLEDQLKQIRKITKKIENQNEQIQNNAADTNKNSDENRIVIETLKQEKSKHTGKFFYSCPFLIDNVCSVYNYKGNKFNLNNYIDPSTGFISSKSQNGIDMKIQERPGLWNGAMADWITVFVEVPPETFTPVKTLVDLLRTEHR